MKTILPVCYMPPINYFMVLSKNQVIMEMHEHFVKQTYRNRCCIYGANGKLNLVIPVKHTGDRTKMKEARIANEIPWQKIHWRSIESAYRTSSYFEFYEHRFASYYDRKFEFLVDFNMALLDEIKNILGLKNLPEYSDSYLAEYKDVQDLRNEFSSKNENMLPQVPPYPQVFSDKFGFINNLSVVDLLFNTGPGASSYL